MKANEVHVPELLWPQQHSLPEGNCNPLKSFFPRSVVSISVNLKFVCWIVFACVFITIILLIVNMFYNALFSFVCSYYTVHVYCCNVYLRGK